MKAAGVGVKALLLALQFVFFEMWSLIEPGVH